MEDADAPGGARAGTPRRRAGTRAGGDVHPMFRSPLGGARRRRVRGGVRRGDGDVHLAHLAAASPAVESRCVFLLVAHAARTSAVGEENSRGETRASVVAKAADILTRLARAMGYPTRREYVARHARVIGALWMRAGISARRLLAVPELVASLGDGDALRLAKEWSRVLLPPAVLAANAGAVRALAEACGRRARRSFARTSRESSRSSSSCRDARPSLAAAGVGGGGGAQGTPARGGGGWRQPRRALPPTPRRRRVGDDLTRASLAEGRRLRRRRRRRRRDDARARAAVSLPRRDRPRRSRAAAGGVSHAPIDASPPEHARGRGSAVDVDRRQGVSMSVESARRVGRGDAPATQTPRARRRRRDARAPGRRGVDTVHVAPAVSPGAPARRRRRARGSRDAIARVNHGTAGGGGDWSGAGGRGRLGRRGARGYPAAHRIDARGGGGGRGRPPRRRARALTDLSPAPPRRDSRPAYAPPPPRSRRSLATRPSSKAARARTPPPRASFRWPFASARSSSAFRDYPRVFVPSPLATAFARRSSVRARLPRGARRRRRTRGVSRRWRRIPATRPKSRARANFSRSSVHTRGRRVKMWRRARARGAAARRSSPSPPPPIPTIPRSPPRRSDNSRD